MNIVSHEIIPNLAPSRRLTTIVYVETDDPKIVPMLTSGNIAVANFRANPPEKI